MVKNLPSVERSTKIRFGKHVPDSNDQEENTIVFNASNVAVPTPYSNAVYLSPIRNRTDYQAPEIVLLMYDRNTKEITESGESANALIGGSTLDTVTNRNNATSNVVQFIGSLTGASFVSDSNVGLSNIDPQHTVSVGSNLYIDEFGSNVLVVSGNVAVLKDMIVEGNLTVNGDTTVIYTENTSIKDAFIELGADNTSGDTTLDLGLLMHRPDALSNVVIGYREGNDEFAIAYTDAQPTDKTFTPKTDEDINVHVYGLTHVDANIYAHEDVLVDGNVYVSQNVSVTEELTVTGNVYADKDLEIVGNAYVDGNVVAYKDLTLSGNAYVTGNVNVTKQLSVSGNAYISGNVEVTESLIVSANTHLKGDNVFITHTMDFLDPTTAIVTDQVSNVQIRLGQLENVANTASNPLINQVLTYDQDNSVWSNAYPDQTIVQVKNTSGAPMTRGQAVHVTGSTGNNTFQIELADASDPTKMPAIGIVYEDIPINGQGAVVTFGRANGISGISGYTNGDTLYVASGTPGGLTNVKPYGVDLDLIQNVGVVVNNSGGVMFVTGIGRSNDIPNARIITDYNDMQYVYVNSENNDLKKITSANLNIPLTTAVSSSSNSTANAVTLRGVSITSGDGFHGDLVVAGNVTVDTNTLKVDAEANRVGILTVSPGYPLDVRGSISTDDYLIHNGDTNTKIGFSGDDTFVVNTNGTEQLKIDTNGNTYVTSNLTVDTNTLHIDSISNRVGILTTLPGQALDVRGAANVGTFTTTTGTVTDGTHSTSKDTGVLVLTQGGLGVEANIHSTNVFATSHIAVGTSATSNTFDVRGTANVGALVTTSTHISDSTTATSKTTGALQVTGGVGIQGDIHATHANLEDVEADSVTVTDATEATSTTTGALKVTGGVGIQKDLYARDGHFSTDVSVGSLTNKKIPYANASKILTDSQISQEADGTVVISNDVEITGTLLVSGDSFEVSAGELIIQDRIIDIANNNPDHDLDIGILMEHPGHNIGLIHHPEDYFSMGYTQNGYSDTHILRDYSNEFTLNVWGYVTTQNTVTIEHNDLYVKDGLIGVNTDSPLADLHVVGNAFVTSNITTSSNVLITGDAAATSKTTGALQVAGGVGVQGDIYGVKLYTDDYLTHINDTNTKIGFPANDTFTITTSGTERVRVDSSGGVGIGTVNPSHLLELNSTTSGNILKIGNNTSYTRWNNGGHHIDVYNCSDNTGRLLYLNYYSQGGVRIDNNLGVNGHSTTDNLYVVGNARVTSDFEVGEVANLYVDTETSRVGINTDSPAYNLDVRGTSNVGVFTTPDASVTDSTASSSKTTGALKVTGGVGVSGALYGAAATFDGVTSVTNATASTSKTSGALKVTGGVGVAGALYGAAATFDGVTSVTNATASTSKTSGALKVTGGVGVQGALYGAAATFDGVTSVTNAIASTSKTTGALRVTGGVGVGGSLYATTLFTDQNITHTGDTNTYIGFPTTDAFRIVTNNSERLRVDSLGNIGINDSTPSYKLDVNGTGRFTGLLTGDAGVSVPSDGDFIMNSKPLVPASGLHWDRVNNRLGVGTNSPATKLHVAGGTIINSDGVAKKTYSYTGDLGAGQTVANSTIKITFSNHVFYAKIVAHLVESDDEVSTLSLECGGGNWSGGTPLAIAKGPQAIFGSTSTDPWDSATTTTTTEVSFKPTTAMAADGHYNVFIEYISQSSAGKVSKVTVGTTDVVTFTY